MTFHGVLTASSGTGQRSDLRHGGRDEALKEVCAALAFPLNLLAGKGLKN